MEKYTNWKQHPFTSDGVDFISYVDSESRMGKQIEKLPAEIFQMMNANCIDELMGEVSVMSIEEILNKLETVNEGYQSAYIALA